MLSPSKLNALDKTTSTCIVGLLHTFYFTSRTYFSAFKQQVRILYIHIYLSWFRLPPATKAPRGRPSPRRRAEENEKKEAETGGSG